MTRSEYAKRASNEEIWEAIDVYGNHYEFDNEADAYMFCYDYIEKALCDDHDEFHEALFELDESGEANDLIGYRLKGEEDAD